VAFGHLSEGRPRRVRALKAKCEQRQCAPILSGIATLYVSLPPPLSYIRPSFALAAAVAFCLQHFIHWRYIVLLGAFRSPILLILVVDMISGSLSLLKDIAGPAPLNLVYPCH
jgi:hypothetical protein